MQSTGSTTTSRKSRAAHAPASDALSILMEDHKQIQRLFREFDQAYDGEDEEACQQIAEITCAELEVHTTLEEELFYPAAREALADDQELVDEAEIEHYSAKELIAQLRATDGGDHRLAATFTVLAEHVKHHMKNEEAELFPKLKETTADLQTLGEEMRARKAELTEEMGLDVDESRDRSAGVSRKPPGAATRAAR